MFPYLFSREAVTFLQLHLVAAFEAQCYFVMAPLFVLKLKGLEFLNLICRAERLKALNSCSVPTLPCCLGIWLLFIHIYFFSPPALQQKAAITCTIIYEASWRAMTLIVVGFAQTTAAIPITRSISEASCPPPLPLSLPTIPFTML